VRGRPLDDAKTYKLATSDFLTTGGDKALERLHLADTAIHTTDLVIRDAMVAALRARKGTPQATIDPAKLLAHHHLDYTGKRPLGCSHDGTEPDE
jgi:hypothetical protein